jgi:hypothetical protein
MAPNRARGAPRVREVTWTPLDAHVTGKGPAKLQANRKAAQRNVLIYMLTSGEGLARRKGITAAVRNTSEAGSLGANNA